MNRLDDLNEAIDEMETEQAKRDVAKMPKCYFCGGDCYSNTTISINCGNLNQSELFKAYVCGECAESVKSALILLRTVTPKREEGDSNV